MPQRSRQILVIDDDPMVREMVTDVLDDSGFKCIAVGSAEEAGDILSSEDISLMVVDLGLPGMDGLTFTRNIKASSDMGIIILSGRGDTMEKIIGLEVGADDYLGKPFEPRELVARVRSILRRTAPDTPPSTDTASVSTDTYMFLGMILDANKRSLISPDGDQIDLSTSEYEMLFAFVTHPNTVLCRDQLMDMIFSNDAPAFDRSIDIRVARLRKKIDTDPSRPKIIKTVRNAGYIFTPDVTRG